MTASTQVNALCHVPNNTKQMNNCWNSMHDKGERTFENGK